MATQTVTISLPIELIQDLDLLANDRDMGRDALIERLLRNYQVPELPEYSEEDLLASIQEADAGLTSPLEEVIDRIRSRAR